MQSDVGHHPFATGFHHDATRAVTAHFGSALLYGSRLVAGAKCISAVPPLGARRPGACRRCRRLASGMGRWSARCDADVEAEILNPSLEPLRLNRGIVSELKALGTWFVKEGAVGE